MNGLNSRLSTPVSARSWAALAMAFTPRPAASGGPSRPGECSSLIRSASLRGAAAPRTPSFLARPREAVLVCEHDGGRAVPQAELREDVADVGLHGSLADEQLAADLLVRGTTGDQPQHVQLSPGELVDLRGLLGPGQGLGPVGLEDPSRHGRVEPRAAAGHHAGGPDDVLARRILQHEPGRARGQGGLHHLVVVERREHEDGGRVVSFPQAPGGLRTVHPLHPNVHEHHVGPGLSDGIERLPPILALPHDLEAVSGPQDAGQPGAHEGLVVHQQDPDHGATPSGAAFGSLAGSTPVVRSGSSTGRRSVRATPSPPGSSPTGSAQRTVHPGPSGPARNVPPSRVARSCIPRSPRPPPSYGEIPPPRAGPESCTLISAPRDAISTVTSARAPGAWRTTLFRDSWTIR